MKRIKKNDTVIIVAGRSKGHLGKVLRVVDDKVVVENGNTVRKHVKPNPQLNEAGGITTIEAPIHVSNVALYNPETKKADRIGFRFIEKDGKKHKVRYFKSNNEVVDLV